MPWLWNSWEEYVDIVHPAAADKPGPFRAMQFDSWFEMEARLFAAVGEFKEKVEELKKLGFSRDLRMGDVSKDKERIRKAWDVVLNATYAGEELLLHHKRLAKHRAAYGFLHQNHLVEHWDRYAAGPRIYKEVHQFIIDAEELMNGYHELVQSDEEFILRDLDMTAALEADFRLARNLFSVGFDDVGLLIAGRGLEGVLRKIAEVRKIFLKVGNRTIPACEIDLHDVIETMYRVKWKKTGRRLINQETKALLQYLRTLRNSGAHPAGTQYGNSPREQATVAARTANQLWNAVTSTRARLEPSTVDKNW